MKITECKPLIMYITYFLTSCILMFLVLKVLFPGIKIYTIKNTLSSMITATLISVLLYFLCSRGYMRTAWVVGSIPVILGIFVILFSVVFLGASTAVKTE